MSDSLKPCGFLACLRIGIRLPLIGIVKSGPAPGRPSRRRPSPALQRPASRLVSPFVAIALLALLPPRTPAQFQPIPQAVALSQADGRGIHNIDYTAAQVGRGLSRTRYRTNGSMLNGSMLMFGPNGKSFHLYDWFDPFQPGTEISSITCTHPVESLPHAVNEQLRGSTLYVAMPATKGFEIYDWTNPTSPRLVSYLALNEIVGDDFGLAWQGPALYVTGESAGLYVVDTSNIGAPRLVKRFNSGEVGIPNIGPISVLGNLMVVTGLSTRGVSTWNISDPWNPVRLDIDVTPGDDTDDLRPYDVEMVNNHAITAVMETKLNRQGIALYDLSNPSDIKFTSRIAFNNGNGRTEMIAAQDTFIHAASSGVNSSNSEKKEERYHKVDISNPATPRVVLTVKRDVLDNGQPDYIFAVNNLVYLGHVFAGYPGTIVIPHQAQRDATPPRVQRVNPPNGATQQALTTRVGILFSDMVDFHPSTINTSTILVRPVGGTALQGTYTMGRRIINFTPSAALAANTTYEVVIPANTLRDMGGNLLTSEFRSTFSTGSTISSDPKVSLSRIAPTLGGAAATFTATITGVSASAVTYSFNFGDGSAATAFASSNQGTRTFLNAGHYSVKVTAKLTDGRQVSDTVLHTVHWPLTSQKPTSSRTLALDPSRNRIWVVNPDNDTVTAVDVATRAKAFEVATGSNPRAVARAADGTFWVANAGSDSVTVHDAANGAVVRTIAFPYGSAPRGLAMSPDGAVAYVALHGDGALARLDTSSRAITHTRAVGPTPRGIAVSHDGSRVLVTRFISPDARGEVYEVRGDTLAPVRTMGLPLEETPDTAVSGRGVPNYLQSIAIRPDGRRAWIAAKKDNILRGHARDGLALNFENTVRAIVAQIDMNANAEAPEGRLDINDNSLPAAVAFTPLGDYAAVALLGSAGVVVLDSYSGREVTSFDTQLAPDGILFSDDGKLLFVHNFLSRSLTIRNADALVSNTSFDLPELRTIGLVAQEKLAPAVLQGKRLFYNAADTRMTKDRYLSCAACHLDGDDDGRVWDFTDRGEGLRNTVSLRGRAGATRGRVHWSGNFDEIQDFEHDIRTGFSGSGFLTDAQFNSGTRNQPLGDAKAGLNSDLDALAAYVTSLSDAGRSPHRTESGALTADALQGQTLFSQLTCTTCHAGDVFSDSATGRRHDVGTIKTTSGKRLGATLDGFDTPELAGLWETAPYLHDGSAATVRDVLTTANPNARHGNLAGLTSAQIDQLVAFLLQIESPVPQNGLKGEYFSNRTLSGAPTLTRTDPQVNFDFGNGAPGSGLPVDQWSARWTGFVQPSASGSFAFQTVSDDGVRLWVNDVLVIDNWTDHAPTANTSAALTLTAGHRYPVRMEFYEAGGGALARLNWIAPGGSATAIPTSALFLNNTGGTSTGGTSTGGSTGGGSTGGSATGGSSTGTGFQQGLAGTYFNSKDLTGAAVLTRVDGPIDFNWTGSPGGSVRADDFSVRWTGVLEPTSSGNHTFQTEVDDGVRLWVNNVLVIDNWVNQAPTVKTSAPVALTAGTRYDIKLEYYEACCGAVIRLRWTPPGSSAAVAIPLQRLFTPSTGSSTGSSTGGSGPAGTGLSGTYFHSKDLTGASIMTRVDGPIDFNWTGSPGGSVRADDFSVRWTGSLQPPASGSYTFQTEADDGIRLWVNNQLVIDNFVAQPPTVKTSSPLTLTAGQSVPIKIEFFEGCCGAVARLRWTVPGASGPVAVPKDRLSP